MDVAQASIFGWVFDEVELYKDSKERLRASVTIIVNKKHLINGQQIDEKVFIKCYATANTATAVSREFKIGSRVCVLGDLKSSRVKNKNSNVSNNLLRVEIKQYVIKTKFRPVDGQNDDRENDDRQVVGNDDDFEFPAVDDVEFPAVDGAADDSFAGKN